MHPPDPDRLAASRRRLSQAGARAATLEDYAQALLIHVNEAAAALRHPADPPRGSVFRVGLAYLGEDGLVIPVPFRHRAPSLFLDQFHVLPLHATSLGSLVERGRGDRIDDMEAHLASRGISLSSQVALREGIRSNVRLPWRSLDRHGFLWFSADTPRFFDDALFAHLEGLVPEVELHLRLLDVLSPLLPTGPARPASLEGSVEGLGRLGRLLEVEENPFPGRLALDWNPPAAGPPGLVNLWRLGEGLALLASLECTGSGAAAHRLLLALRGWILQQAVRWRNPSRLCEEVEALLATAWRDGALPRESSIRAVALAVLHLDSGQTDHVVVGGPRLWIEQDGETRPLAYDPSPAGARTPRQAGVVNLGGGRLLLAQGDRSAEAGGHRLAIRLSFAP